MNGNSLIPEQLIESAGRSPGAAALCAAKRTVTYAELSAAMNLLAERLIAEGLHKGERVMLLLGDDCDRIVATLGVIRSGGIAVPLPASIEFSSVDAIARQCEPFALLTSRDQLLTYPLLRDKLSCKFIFLEEPGGETGYNRISALNIDGPDGSLLIYEDDTSTRKKGMLFTHSNLLAELRIIREADPPDAIRRELVLHPSTEVLGMTRILHLLTSGATVCLPAPDRSVAEIGDDLTGYGCTAISAGARTLAASIEQLAERLGESGKRIQHVEICGSSLSAAQKRQLLAIFPSAGVVGFYGPSEAPRSAVLRFTKEGPGLESSGKPASGVEIMIRNGGKKPARAGDAGEVGIRGGHAMARLWNDRLRTPESDEGHWLRNGDVGFLDNEGFLHILGGAEDFIHVAGGVISPFEVEGKIKAIYPECEICVLGIPDPLDSGNEIAVLCYTTPGNRTIILSELSRSLGDHISRNKIPKIVYRIERFPHTGEMIHRKELRKRILHGVAMDEKP